MRVSAVTPKKKCSRTMTPYAEGDYEVFSISSSHKAIILRLEEVKESKKNHESEEGEKLKEDKGSEGRKEFEGDLKLEGDKKSEGDKKFKVALYRDESYEEAPECVRTRQWEGIRWIGSIHLDKLNLGEMYHAIDDMDPLSIATEDSGMKRFRRRRKLPPWLKASQALPNQILPTLAASETLTGGENKS